MILEVISISPFLYKYLLLQSIKDEELRKKIFSMIVGITIAFIIIITAIGSIPSIVMSGIFDGDIEDMEKVLVYQDTVFTIDNLNKEWIEEMKEDYNYCDDFEIIYNYNLTWYELISIDSVLLNQDFRKMDSNKIQEIGLEFIIRTVDIIEREVEEEYEEVIELEDGTTEIIIQTRTVIKKIAIITVDTKNFEDVFPNVNIVDEEDVLLALNIYDTMLSMDIEGDLNIYDGSIDFGNLQEYPAGNAYLPYYNQADKRWGHMAYGSSNIAKSGCGPTSLAMVVAGLTDHNVNPLDVANWSYRNGHRAEGSGSYWSLMTAGGRYYGLNVEPVNRNSPGKVVEALSQGYPIIVSMSRGHFTNGGHFIVLRGITEDGRILVHDSASVERSNQSWDLRIIMNESSTNGGINGSPFWIFRP